MKRVDIKKEKREKMKDFLKKAVLWGFVFSSGTVAGQLISNDKNVDAFDATTSTVEAEKVVSEEFPHIEVIADIAVELPRPPAKVSEVSQVTKPATNLAIGNVQSVSRPVVPTEKVANVSKQVVVKQTTEKKKTKVETKVETKESVIAKQTTEKPAPSVVAAKPTSELTTPVVAEEKKGSACDNKRLKKDPNNPLHQVNSKRDCLILEAIQFEREGVDSEEAWQFYREFESKQHPAWVVVKEGKFVYTKEYYAMLLQSVVGLQNEVRAKGATNMTNVDDNVKAEDFDNEISVLVKSLNNAPGLTPYIIGVNNNKELSKEYGVEEASGEWFNSPLNNPLVRSEGKFQRNYYFENPLLVEIYGSPEAARTANEVGNANASQFLIANPIAKTQKMIANTTNVISVPTVATTSSSNNNADHVVKEETPTTVEETVNETIEIPVVDETPTTVEEVVNETVEIPVVDETPTPVKPSEDATSGESEDQMPVIEEKETSKPGLEIVPVEKTPITTQPVVEKGEPIGIVLGFLTEDAAEIGASEDLKF